MRKFNLLSTLSEPSSTVSRRSTAHVGVKSVDDRNYHEEDYKYKLGHEATIRRLEMDYAELKTANNRLTYDYKSLVREKNALNEVNDRLEYDIKWLKEQRSMSTVKDEELYKLRQENQVIKSNVIAKIEESAKMKEDITLLVKHVDGRDDVMVDVLGKNQLLTKECERLNDMVEHLKERYRTDIHSTKESMKIKTKKLEDENCALRREFEVMHAPPSRSSDNQTQLPSLIEKNEELNVNLNQLKDKYRNLEVNYAKLNNGYEELLDQFNKVQRSSNVDADGNKRGENYQMAIDKYRTKIQSLEQQLKSFQEKEIEKPNQISTRVLQSQIKELEMQLNRHREKYVETLANLEREVRELREKNDRLNKEVTERDYYESKMGDLERELRLSIEREEYNIKLHKKEVQELMDDSKKTISDLNEKVEKLQKEGVVEPRTSPFPLTDTYEMYFNSISSPYVNYDSLKEERVTLSDSARILVEKDETINDLQLALKSLQEQEDGYKTEIASLGNKVLCLQYEHDQLHSDLTECRENRSREITEKCIITQDKYVQCTLETEISDYNEEERLYPAENRAQRNTISKFEREKNDLIKTPTRVQVETKSSLYSENTGSAVFSSIPSESREHRSDLIQQIADLKAERAELKDELCSKTAELTKKQNAISTMKEKIKAQNTECNIDTFTQMKLQNSNYTNQLAANKDELDKLRNTIKQLSDKLAQTQKDYHNLEAEMNNIKILNFGKEVTARQTAAAETTTANNNEPDLLTAIPDWWYLHMTKRGT